MVNRVLFLAFFLISVRVLAQPPLPVFKGAIAENRQLFYDQAVAQDIDRNLNKPLRGDTEEDWMAAFDVMSLLQFHNSFVDNKIDSVVKDPAGRTVSFLKSLLGLLNNNYPGYSEEVGAILKASTDKKLFTMAATYLLQQGSTADSLLVISETKKRLDAFNADDFWNVFLARLQHQSIGIRAFFDKHYLPGNVLVISLQRPNRNFPGLALIRDTAGNFLMENDSMPIAIPQLARSLSNMPGYISMGNTPVGVLRMAGFDTSRSYFIGPTTNVQLTLPFEFRASHYFKDSTLADSAFTKNRYSTLLPQGANSPLLYEAYYAGKAGRSEIIAHGTTVDPAYYSGRPYFPFPPTAGCLTTEEWWSPTTGRRMKSGQQQLADAISKAGGPNGYYIVLELNDEQRSVSPDEIIGYLPKIGRDKK